MTISVLTASLPERGGLISECNASVVAQTERALEHLVSFDFEHVGPAIVLNNLATMAEGDWLFRLDDDDLLDPDHFAVLSRWLTDDVDIVYTYCRVIGGGGDEARFQRNYQATHGWEFLQQANWIPCSAAIRRTLWSDLGGLRDVPLEDWDLWRRAQAAGARFACVPAVTWTYRVNPEWAHRNTEQVEAMRGLDA